MSNALFHATYGKDVFFQQALLEAGFDSESIFAICTQVEQRENLNLVMERGHVLAPASRPSRNGTPWRGLQFSRDVELMAEVANCDPIDLILGDRHLRRRPLDSAVAWVNRVVDTFEIFLDRVNPVIVLGETANCSEILMWATAARRGIPYVQPAPLRVPGGRFGLWLGARSEQLWRRPRIEEDVDDAYSLSSWLNSRERPFDFDINSTSPTLTLSNLSHSILSASKRSVPFSDYEMQRPTLGDYISLPWMNRAKKWRYGKQLHARTWEDVPSGEFVFYPLHVQPESSIDWFPRWRDQLAAASIIAREIRPLGLTLAVKEHPNFAWSRGAYFHDALIAAADYVAVDPRTDSRALMESAVATVTVSGTIGLEAGLTGNRVIVGSNHPWRGLPTVAYAATPHDVASHLLMEVSPSPSTVQKWYDAYVSSSWQGLISDSITSPEVLEKSNIVAVARAFDEFICASR